MKTDNNKRWNLDLRDLTNNLRPGYIIILKNNSLKITTSNNKERQDIKRLFKGERIPIETAKSQFENLIAWKASKGHPKHKVRARLEALTEASDVLLELESEITSIPGEFNPRSWKNTTMKKEGMRETLLECWETRCQTKFEWVPKGKPVSGANTEEVVTACYEQAEKTLRIEKKNRNQTQLLAARNILASRCFEETKKTNEKIHPMDKLLGAWIPGKETYSFFLTHTSGPGTIRVGTPKSLWLSPTGTKAQHSPKIRLLPKVKLPKSSDIKPWIPIAALIVATAMLTATLLEKLNKRTTPSPTTQPIIAQQAGTSMTTQTLVANTDGSVAAEIKLPKEAKPTSVQW